MSAATSSPADALWSLGCPPAATRRGGFTLIELMTVIVIVAILAAVAIPSYEWAMIKSRRKTAAACLVEAGGFMERFYATNFRYDKTLADVDVSLPTLGCMTDLSDHYTFDLNPTPTQTSFRVRATPKGAQEKDTDCGTLTLTESGQKGESGTKAVKDCW